jgi:hypothetical protein
MKMSRYDTAKNTDLVALAERMGFKVLKQGRSWSGTQCPVCGESVDGSTRLSIFMSGSDIYRWKCFACGDGVWGTAIDFVVAVAGCSANQAVNRLLEGTLSNVPSIATATRSRQDVDEEHDCLAKVLHIIGKRALDVVPAVMGYLVRLRICSDVVAAAVAQGRLRMLPSSPDEATRWLMSNVGENLLRRSGLLKEGRSKPAIAYRPLVFLLPEMTGAEFHVCHEVDESEVKSISYGRLQWPWVLKGKHTNHFLIVDSAIDALSAATLGEDGGIMGLPGNYAWQPGWFPKTRKRYGSSFVLGLDNKEAGNRVSEAIAAQLSQLDIPFSSKPPPKGMNWNNVLQQQ